jgi:ABC-type thiamine transport system substrate-binding protein
LTVPDASPALLVYATPGRAPVLRPLLQAACRAVGVGVRLELLDTGSLFRRLHLESGEPKADVVAGSGPYALHAAALDAFLEAHQPAAAAPPVANLLGHEASWRWAALDYSPWTLVGDPPVDQLDSPAVKTLAVPDPARSEMGVMLLLGELDRARQTDRDTDAVWARWRERSVDGRLLLVDEPAAAVAAVTDGRASHARVAAAAGGTPLPGLAPLPNAVGLVKGAPHEAAARQLLDWLLGEPAGAALAGGPTLSPWQADRNGLAALAAAAPALDLAWTFGQYRAVRKEWLARGLAMAAP